MQLSFTVGSTDAENGVKMACRDRFGGDGGGDAAPAAGDTAGTAGAGGDAGPGSTRDAGPAGAPGLAADTADQQHAQAPAGPAGAPQGTHDQAQPASARHGEGLEVYGDSAYGSGEARAAYRDAGHDTVIKPGPVRPAVPMPRR